MKTKVRVKRAELLKVVEGRRRKAEAEYKRAMDAYPGREENWFRAAERTLEAALKRVKANKDGFKYNRIELPEKPLKPTEGKELCNLRRMEQTLRIGAEETILLSQEDADWYFGPCKL